MDVPQLPSFIATKLFSGERVVWFGRPSHWRLALPFLGVAIFLFAVVREQNIVLVAIVVFAYPLIFAAGCHFVLTDRRAMVISRYAPPFLQYQNLIDDLAGPTQIKLDFLAGVRFGSLLHLKDEGVERLFSGRVPTVFFFALTDSQAVFTLAVSTQRAAMT